MPGRVNTRAAPIPTTGISPIHRPHRGNVLKNITRTLILAGLIGPLAHPLAAQVRSSVSYDYQYVSDFEGCESQHAHGVDITASYDLLSAGDNIERVFALIAGFGVNRSESDTSCVPRSGVPRPGGTVVIRRSGGVGAALFVRGDIIEFHLSAIPGLWYKWDSNSATAWYNVRTALGLAAWLQQDFGLQAGVGADSGPREIHIHVGIALRF